MELPPASEPQHAHFSFGASFQPPAPRDRRLEPLATILSVATLSKAVAVCLLELAGGLLPAVLLIRAVVTGFPSSLGGD